MATTAGLTARRALVVAAAAASLVPAASAQALTVSAGPALYPAFSPSVSDYAVRCEPGKPVRLEISTADGETASVDGGAKRSGSFEQDVPLAAGQATVVTAATHDASADYHMRCLPPDFPHWSAQRSGPTQAQWYLVTAGEHYATFFDSNGVPVWWRKTRRTPVNPTYLGNGDVAWYSVRHLLFGTAPNSRWDEQRLDGKRVRRVHAVGTPTDLHEIQRLPNGNYLVDAFRPRHGVNLKHYGGPRRALVYYAEIQEVTPEGHLVWRWNSRGHIALREAKRYLRQQVRDQRDERPSKRWFDAAHINSIEPDGDGFVISLRHTDAVYRITRRGRVDWKVGGTHVAQSLRIVGDGSAGRADFGGQHDARLLPDGTLTLFDNGTTRNRSPRLLRFRIDERLRRATRIERVTDPDVPASGWGGSARKLPGGNWVAAWGGTHYVTETTPHGDRVFRLYLVAGQYRVSAVPFGELSAERLRAGMDRMARAAAP